MSRKSPEKYTKEFKLEAVKLVTEHGYSQLQAAKSLGIPGRNLSRWVQEHRTDKQDIVTSEEKELNVLRKEIQKLKLEKEILKKAAAFFANELS